MKTRIIVLALAIASNLALAEAEGASSTSGKLSQLARMENKLGLSDEQVQKMREWRQHGRYASCTHLGAAVQARNYARQSRGQGFLLEGILTTTWFSLGYP